MSKYRSRKLTLSGLALVLGLGLGCSESPTAPTPPPPTSADAGLLDDLFGAADHLLFCPTSETYTSSADIGPAGGTITVGPHRLSVPAGALSETVTITATAPAGDYVDVDLQPHGLVFNSSASLRLSYAHCGLVSGLTGKVAYVDDGFNILELLPSNNDIFRRAVTGKLKHFSSYALAF